MKIAGNFYQFASLFANNMMIIVQQNETLSPIKKLEPKGILKKYF